MSLTPGTRLGPYEIGTRLGVGGMGEIYRARDPRIGRDVAVKALPLSSIGDADRVARFQQEARILGSLNHPHIAALFGLEESGPSQFLIMELLEGGTLLDRLAAGPVAVRDALTIGRQIADALQAAHDRAIIHRDLKPANIAFTADGHAKVLDFGLAKAFGASDGATLVAGATQSGMVLGTVAYMSPEQARGLTLDRRSDIFSFGCVLYEMLAGRNPFSGHSVSDIIAAILDREPDWTRLPAQTPARVRWLLRRCLEKDPRRRLHDIADARIELDEALTSGDSGAFAALEAPTGASRRERVAWLVAGLSLAGIVTTFIVRSSSPTSGVAPPAPVYRTSITLPPRVQISNIDATQFALSPDGKRLAFVASEGDGPSMLWVRPMDGIIPQPVAGTEGAMYPFWSPDSKYIGFVSRLSGRRGNLKKTNAAGGQPIALAEVNFMAGATWNADDVILFTPDGNGPLYRVSAAGGTPTQVTSLDTTRGEVQHSYPHFLPDGKHFLFSTVGSQTGGVGGVRAILVASLDSPDPPRTVVEGGASGQYTDGHLLFLRDGSVMAQPFDATTLETRGPPVTLVERALTSGSFAVSATGVLAYQVTAITPSQLTWFNRAGERIGTVGEPADQVDVVISPDGARAAVSVLDPSVGTRDIWVFDLKRGLRDLVTSNRADEFAPVWAPSGDRLVFSAVRNGGIDIYELAPDGTERRVASGPAGLGKFAASWCPDGRQILYIGGGRIISRSDLMLLPLGVDRNPKPFLNTEFVETQGRFSPDGRWVAYAANDSGRLEVYVRPFPGPGNPTRASDNGGRWPQWRRDGSELFYLAGDGTLVAVTVDGKGPFQVGRARPLFKTRFRPQDRLDAYSYDVSPDGQRFLINAFIEDMTVSAPITLLTNWPALLKR